MTVVAHLINEEAARGDEPRGHQMGTDHRCTPEYRSASDLEQRLMKRKTQTSTGRKLDLMNAVLLDKRIDYYTKAVFNDLIRYRHATTGLCFPSDETIAGDIGGSRTRVAGARRVLRKYGYLDWIKTGRSNLYTFNHAAAGPMLAANKCDWERRKDHREMRQWEAQEALKWKLDL